MRLKIVLMICMLLLGCTQEIVAFKDIESNQHYVTGRWHLINYWAVWCKPCLEEIPELNSFHQREDVDVWGVSFDRLSGDELKTEILKLGIKFPILQEDPAEYFNQLRPTGLPASMLINPEGKFVRWLYGAQTAESLIKYIEIN